MGDIDPLKLDWSQAALYRKIDIKGRPAVAGEQINGETCQSGDIICTSNPARHYRIPAQSIPGKYDPNPTPGGTYKSVSEPRRVVFLKPGEEGHLPAPWKNHTGWDMVVDQPVIEIDNGGSKEYLTQRDFDTAYQVVKPIGPFKFNRAAVQDNDDALIFDATCENVDPAVMDKFELEFSGDNLTFSPAKVALKDIFDAQSGCAQCKVLATPVTVPGDVTAIMKVKINGKGLSQTKRGPYTLG